MRGWKLRGLMVLGLIVVFANLGSALINCDVVERASCTDTIVMGLSAPTNAHAQDSEQTTYPYVLCCDGGGDTNVCGANNESVILRLSASTNAHAEINDPSVIDPPNYGFDVCYNKLENCTYTTSLSTCPVDYPVATVSLSSYTNAHVAQFDSYGDSTIGGRICCKDNSGTSSCGSIGGNLCDYDSGQTCEGTNLSSSDDNPPNLVCCDQPCEGMTGMCVIDDVTWNKASAEEGSFVGINVTGNTDCLGRTVSFQVKKRLDDSGVNQDPIDATFADFGGEIKAITSWQAEWFDDAGSNPQYYVEATGGGDSRTSESSITNPYLTVVQAGVCQPVMTCGSYNNSADCQANPCEGISNVIDNSAILHNGGQLCGYDWCVANNIWYDGCGCSWNTATSKCEFDSTVRSCNSSAGNFTSGTCYNDQGSVKDCGVDPDPNWYMSSWNGTWVWDSGNNFGSEAECTLSCSFGTCINETSILWRCDLEGSQLSCEEGGTRKIPCPEELPLPFFNLYNFLISILLIATIYFTLYKRKLKKF